MRELLAMMRGLGNAGAVANAQAPLTARRREEAAVKALARRLTPPARRRPSGGTRGGRAA